MQRAAELFKVRLNNVELDAIFVYADVLSFLHKPSDEKTRC
jgi:hypothetical protein